MSLSNNVLPMHVGSKTRGCRSIRGVEAIVMQWCRAKVDTSVAPHHGLALLKEQLRKRMATFHK